MGKSVAWEMKLALFLVAASVAIYSTKMLLLHNPENTINYLFNSMGFLPISVLLVTVVLNHLLTIRSNQEKMQKLNMVIGTFFAEVGDHLLTVLSDYDENSSVLRNKLIIGDDWGAERFRSASASIDDYPFSVNRDEIDLAELDRFLMQKRDFLLRLLENPVLLENQTFTELLRAVFHLNEELQRRPGFDCLPESDCRHIEGDIDRVYKELVSEWIRYMEYLKNSYPYMFSLALRTNPFDEEASAIVQ
ncbi:hypothetical protein [Methanogenium sp. MK-MG]|uniref:hypothetical protein n=1 Tax=Methanogenium sp. MK-MG TaxID=2599926 RepID=UPI0013EBD151|nr:hypothetical protein [Methanogenium sp. MK-MG]KAF1078932.1 hypothetical protein MKMG_00201 [Methanogenium sp. MK-MG]